MFVRVLTSTRKTKRLLEHSEVRAQYVFFNLVRPASRELDDERRRTWRGGFAGAAGRGGSGQRQGGADVLSGARSRTHATRPLSMATLVFALQKPARRAGEGGAQGPRESAPEGVGATRRPAECDKQLPARGFAGGCPQGLQLHHAAKGTSPGTLSNRRREGTVFARGKFGAVGLYCCSGHSQLGRRSSCRRIPFLAALLGVVASLHLPLNLACRQGSGADSCMTAQRGPLSMAKGSGQKLRASKSFPSPGEAPSMDLSQQKGALQSSTSHVVFPSPEARGRSGSAVRMDSFEEGRTLASQGAGVHAWLHTPPKLREAREAIGEASADRDSSPGSGSKSAAHNEAHPRGEAATAVTGNVSQAKDGEDVDFARGFENEESGAVTAHDVSDGDGSHDDAAEAVSADDAAKSFGRIDSQVLSSHLIASGLI